MNDLFIIALIIAPYLLCVAMYFIGRRDGRADRNINLVGLGAKEAFAYFLLHEIHRHRQDIAGAKSDLLKLAKAGVKPPDIPTGLWIEVAK